MGQVVFHTGVADKVDYIARLVRKGSRQGARMVVVCDDPAAVSAVRCRDLVGFKRDLDEIGLGGWPRPLPRRVGQCL